MRTNVRLPDGAVIEVVLPYDAESLNDWVPVKIGGKLDVPGIEQFLNRMTSEDEAAVIEALERDITFEKANP